MKRFLGFLTAVMMLFVICSFSVSAEETKKIYLTNVVSMGGGEIEVDIKFETGNTCSCYDVLVRYDERLELSEVKGANNYYVFEDTNGDCCVSLIGYLGGETYQDNSAVATLTFNIPEIYEGLECYNIEFKQITSFSDYDSDFENYKYLNGYIINLPSESNTKVYINEVGVAEYGCRGDINGDNETNVRDAAGIARYCATSKIEVSEASKCFADFNNDSELNIRDAAAIARDLSKGSW